MISVQIVYQCYSVSVRLHLLRVKQRNENDPYILKMRATASSKLEKSYSTESLKISLFLRHKCDLNGQSKQKIAGIRIIPAKRYFASHFEGYEFYNQQQVTISKYIPDKQENQTLYHTSKSFFKKCKFCYTNVEHINNFSSSRHKHSTACLEA